MASDISSKRAAPEGLPVKAWHGLFAAGSFKVFKSKDVFPPGRRWYAICRASGGG